MLYWLPDVGASSARIYWESFRNRPMQQVSVPTGCSIFPKELTQLPEHQVRRRFTDLRYWNELDRGGHFASLERPVDFVAELRAFFRLIR